MLPAGFRLTSSESFRHAVRRGRRAGSSTVVLHLSAPSTDQPGPCRVGFVVSKAVGPAVTRNHVKRQLRHLVREHLRELPDSGVLVVRAQPAAAGASYDELSTDLQRCLSRLGSETVVVGQ